MGKVDDPDDIPTSERLTNQYKVGFKGFDWWWSYTHVALPFFVSFGQWSGPVGYENGWWAGWHLYVTCLVWGCRLDWVSKWVPTDAADPEPRLRTRPRPRRQRTVQDHIDIQNKG